MYFLDLEANPQEWSKVELSGKTPGKFSSSSGVLTESKWYIFGGLIENDQSSNVYVIDLETRVSALVPANSASKVKLQPLDSHTSVLADPKNAVIFGGYFGANKTNKVFVYQITENIWEERKPKDPSQKIPPPRANHSAIFSDGSMYIFGGSSSESEKLNDLWKYDFAKDTWTEILAEAGVWPRPRSGHVALLHENKMYIFGGSLELMQEVNDMLELDLKTNQWTILHAAEKMIGEEERSSPITALKIKKIKEEAKHKMKGETISPKTKKFSQTLKLNLSASMPALDTFNQTLNSPLSGTKKHAKKGKNYPIAVKKDAILMIDEVSSPIVTVMKNSVVMKAISSDKRKVDNTGSLKIVGRFPCGRDGHTGVVHNNKLFIFGGDRHQMAYNDIYSFSLA